MPSTRDFDRFDMTAAELVKMTRASEGIKLVHNLTDRGIIPFRKDGRSRLYSFASVLAFDTMLRARGVGLGLHEGAKLADRVIARAKERVADLYIDLRVIKGHEWLIYAFDREVDPPHLQAFIVTGDQKIADIQLTTVSGWPSDVTSVFPIDRVIWECADSYDRHRKEKDS